MAEPHDTVTPFMLRGISAGSALTGLGERTVWALVNKNAIPHRRIGRAIAFVPGEVQRWIELGCPTKAGSGDRVRKEMSHGEA